MVDIKELRKQYEDILNQLKDPGLISNWKKFEELSKKKANLEQIITKTQELQDLRNNIEENKEIIKSQEYSDLVSLAETETKQLKEKERGLEKELAAIKTVDLAVPKQEKTESVIIEIRAGTGGQEAALFAADLYRMYSRYALMRGWNQKILDSRPSDLGGFKEIVFELRNGDVFLKMQYEAGVHRVQRIPKTEKAGRVHTSTASVAVLLKPKKATISLRPDELKIDVYRASGPGGQYVNKRETAVRITHLPSNIVVTSQTERNQFQNKENAMAILEAKLQELKEIKELEKLSEKRRAQIKWAKRAEKIRTYNFPQDRITDHRIKKTFHNLEAIMDGELDKIVKTLSQSL